MHRDFDYPPFGSLFPVWAKRFARFDFPYCILIIHLHLRFMKNFDCLACSRQAPPAFVANIADVATAGLIGDALLCKGEISNICLLCKAVAKRRCLFRAVFLI